MLNLGSASFNPQPLSSVDKLPKAEKRQREHSQNARRINCRKTELSGIAARCSGRTPKAELEAMSARDSGTPQQSRSRQRSKPSIKPLNLSLGSTSGTSHSTPRGAPSTETPRSLRKLRAQVHETELSLSPCVTAAPTLPRNSTLTASLYRCCTTLLCHRRDCSIVYLCHSLIDWLCACRRWKIHRKLPGLR